MKKNIRILLFGLLAVALIIYIYQVFFNINSYTDPEWAFKRTPTPNSTSTSSASPSSTSSSKDKMCGGIMGLPCPTGYYCQLDGEYPDAAGKCIGAQQTCTANSGKWLDEYNECENIQKQLCDSLGGAFNECESACRHQETDYCIFLCVPVCKF